VIFCCSQRSQTLTAISKVLLQSKTMIANVPRIHAVPPTDLVDRNAEGGGDLPAFGGTGGPASDGDGFDPFGREAGPVGDVLDGQLSLLKQKIDRFHPVPAVPVR